jgi:hypothetical protein
LSSPFLVCVVAGLAWQRMLRASRETRKSPHETRYDAREPRRLSIQMARFLGQHDRNAVADRVGKLGGA